MCTAFGLNLCKKKSMQLKLFLPYKFASQSGHFAEPAWSSSRCDWSIAKTFILTCKGHWPVVYASNLQHIFFAQSSLLRTKPHGVVLRVWSRTTLAQGAEVNLLVFITSFGVKHEKLCNFELLLFESGKTYLTSFLIFVEKSVLFQSV